MGLDIILISSFDILGCNSSGPQGLLMFMSLIFFFYHFLSYEQIVDGDVSSTGQLGNIPIRFFSKITTELLKTFICLFLVGSALPIRRHLLYGVERPSAAMRCVTNPLSRSLASSLSQLVPSSIPCIILLQARCFF